jgi:alpha-glucosidase
MQDSLNMQTNTAVQREDWWRGAVIYQIYPRSFQDSNGDGIGDLAGIVQRLDHVAALGADAIWLSPFFTSPMRDFGYDVADYKNVDPMFGSLDDFRQLVKRARELDIKVLIDLVLSHTSDKHPWFEESRASRNNAKADWYVWVDPKADGTPPNNWLSLFGGPAWEWDARRQQYYMHNFFKEQPDLNFHNPEVQDAILDIAKFWLDLGVNGFRLDTVNFYFHDRQLRDNPPNPKRDNFEIPLSNPYSWQDHRYDKTQPENLVFLARLRSLLDQYGDTVTLGEVGDGERGLSTIATYTAGSTRLHMCYAFDFLSRSFGKAHVEKTVKAFERTIGSGWGCWAFSNHDVVRHISRWAEFIPDQDALGRFCIALLNAMRGSICIYQGEEFGFRESTVPPEMIQDPYGKVLWPEFIGRDGCRTPMAWNPDEPNAGFSSSAQTWLPVDREQVLRAGRALSGKDAVLLDDYRKLIGLRHSHRALRDGDLRFLPSVGEVMAFERWAGDDRIVCAFNFGSTESELSFPSNPSAREIHAVNAHYSSGHVRFGAAGAIYLQLTTC